MAGCFTLEKETSSWFLLHLATLGQPTKIEADFENTKEHGEEKSIVMQTNRIGKVLKITGPWGLFLDERNLRKTLLRHYAKGVLTRGIMLI